MLNVEMGDPNSPPIHVVVRPSALASWTAVTESAKSPLWLGQRVRLNNRQPSELNKVLVLEPRQSQLRFSHVGPIESGATPFPTWHRTPYAGAKDHASR